MCESSIVVSVIIPSYNYGAYISDALKSLQAQSFRFWEALVIDDGSSDDTASVVGGFVESDCRIRYFYQVNAGTSAAKNTGLKLSVGKYIVFLDADDLFAADKLRLHVDHLERSPHVDISFSRFRYFLDGQPDRLFTRYDLSSQQEWQVAVQGGDRETIPVFMRENNMTIHAPMLRRSLVQRVGFFDVRLSALEDWDYWLRCCLCDAYFELLGSDGAFALTRVHARSVTRNLSFSIYKDLVYFKVRESLSDLIGYDDGRLYMVVLSELLRQERKRNRKSRRFFKLAIGNLFFKLGWRARVLLVFKLLFAAKS